MYFVKQQAYPKKNWSVLLIIFFIVEKKKKKKKTLVAQVHLNKSDSHTATE